MKKLRNILITISVVLAGAISILGIYGALDSDFIYGFGNSINNAGLLSGIRVGLFFISLLFLAIVVVIPFTFKKGEKNKEAIKITNAGGTVSISSQTLESLARLEAQNAVNVYDIRTDVTDAENKPTVEVRAKVPPTVSIPEISMALQDNIRTKILESTGTDIENVKILIDGIVDHEKK